ncbi:MAG: hypothetical protein Q7N50_06520, partial [Armatimonadota bacterium]|nr:hypothetical protein [Armatimonadota bacterium]
WLKFADKLSADLKKTDFEYWNAHNAALAPASAPAAEKVAVLGKKEMKVVAAGQAGKDTEWENLLRPAPANEIN